MTGKILVKLLKEKGWVLDRVQGSHYIMKKEGKTETVPVHRNKDLPTGLADAVMKRTGLK
jgi:Predicted periplasmic or secreted lipoprotein